MNFDQMPSEDSMPKEQRFDFDAAEMEEREDVARNHGYQPDEIHQVKGRWFDKDNRPIRDKRFDGRREDRDANPYKRGGA